MANTSGQEEFLAVIRKSQEAVIAMIRNLAETVRTANLPKPPSVSVPFADKLPGPEDAVVRTYDFAEQLLASQRKFAEDLLRAKPEGAVASTYDFAEQLLASQRKFAEELLKEAETDHGRTDEGPAPRVTGLMSGYVRDQVAAATTTTASSRGQSCSISPKKGPSVIEDLRGPPGRIHLRPRG